jgi:hypothetical protein
MKVGMDEFTVFFAGWAFATGIVGCAIAAIYILGISQRECQFARAFRTQEKLCMAYPVFENCTPETLFQRLLPDYITEFHSKRWENLRPKVRVFYQSYEVVLCISG